MKTLIIKVNGRHRRVSREDYVRAKTKALREFGYATLTEEETERQVQAVLDMKELTKGLDVIGHIMKDDIVKDGGDE